MSSVKVFLVQLWASPHCVNAVTVVHTTASICPKLSCCYDMYVVVTLEAILCSISVIYISKLHQYTLHNQQPFCVIF